MTDPIVNVTTRTYNIEVTKKENQVISYSKQNQIFVSSPGPQGVSGIVAQTEPPENTTVLWVDTDDVGIQSIPSGGLNGQVLAKLSDSDYHIGWIGAGGVSGSIGYNLDGGYVNSNYGGSPVIDFGGVS